MLILLVLWSVMPALVEPIFIGSDVALHEGEVIMMCPLTANVKDTRYGIVVKYFPDPHSSADEVLDCYWPNNGDKVECVSRYSFTLKGQLTDMVMAKVPESRLRDNGTYKCQLVPPDNHHPFTLCRFVHISVTEKGENFADTDTPVVSSTAADCQEPVERETRNCWDGAGEGMITAILILLILLVVLITSMFILYFLHQRKALRTTTSCTALTISAEEKPMI